MQKEQRPKSARQKWNEARPTKVILFWSIVAAVALTMIVGFNWGGWTTGANAQKQADNAARTAVTERLAPICVAQFNLDPERGEKLLALQETSTYQRTSFVTDHTWATMPGESEPDRQVAAECARLLMELEYEE